MWNKNNNFTCWAKIHVFYKKRCSFLSVLFCLWEWELFFQMGCWSTLSFIFGFKFGTANTHHANSHNFSKQTQFLNLSNTTMCPIFKCCVRDIPVIIILTVSCVHTIWLRSSLDWINSFLWQFYFIFVWRSMLYQNHFFKWPSKHICKSFPKCSRWNLGFKCEENQAFSYPHTHSFKSNCVLAMCHLCIQKAQFHCLKN